MISPHNEIEAKLLVGTAGDGYKVDVDAFKLYVNTNYEVLRYEVVGGVDDYYESGLNVVRHRKDRTAGHRELTVKKRKSAGSIRDRLEVDLYFSPKTTDDDVDAFLRATGFTHVFTLAKQAHIFWVRLSPRLNASIVIYDVQVEGEPATNKRFVELEAEKGSTISVDRAKRYINEGVTKLRAAFTQVDEPLNESLYEIYSGKAYQTV